MADAKIVRRSERESKKRKFEDYITHMCMIEGKDLENVHVTVIEALSRSDSE